MTGRSGLGEFEQLVLLAIVRLESGAFAPNIADELENLVGRGVTRGALYSTLNRLESKDLVEWEAEDPDEGRRGHIRRRFSITPAGLLALRERRQALLRLWDGIEGVLDGSAS